MAREEKLFIVNRSFWPESQLIGEGLLRLAEQQANTIKVGVVFQQQGNTQSQLADAGRGKGVGLYPCELRAVSGSSIVKRIGDALVFMCWVAWVLVRYRPTKVYVSTNPPVVVPFVVMLYSKLFRAKFIYHLQDIHPEITNVVVPINKLLYRCLRWLDAITMRHANLLLTITDEMAHEIRARSKTTAPIETMPNPSASFEDIVIDEMKPGFTFCGNAGRLQRIPLLIEAIKEYANQGGTLPFVFAGTGVHAKDLEELAVQCENVVYKGRVPAHEAAVITASYNWALLPIDDEVTRYAFPSKSSTYALSGANILAICNLQTSVAQWVVSYGLGEALEPNVEALVVFFFKVQKGKLAEKYIGQRKALHEVLSIEKNAENLAGFLGKV